MHKTIYAVSYNAAFLSEFTAPGLSTQWGALLYGTIGALLAISVTLAISLLKLYRKYYDLVNINQLLKEEGSLHRRMCYDVSGWVCSLLSDLTSDLAMSVNHDELLIHKIQRRFSASEGKSESISRCVVSLADIAYNGISRKLGERFSKLSDTDIEICCLILLDFPPNGIQHIYRHTNNQSYYNFRKRLRNKMQIHHEKSIKGFLLEIASDGELYQWK